MPVPQVFLLICVILEQMPDWFQEYTPEERQSLISELQIHSADIAQNFDLTEEKLEELKACRLLNGNL